MTLMSETEKLHIKAHSNTMPTWVRFVPLEWEKWNMKSEEWIAAARRRLRVDVITVERSCRLSKRQRCDVKGNHATACPGESSRILKHNSVRDVIARAIREAGYKTNLLDGRRPGDIIVYN